MVNIPNTLTLFRILLVPVFIAVYYMPFGWSNIAALIVYSLAALTDWFDGYLARKLNQQSALGAAMDPLADKLMVVIVLVLLVADHPENNWLLFSALVIISREITISTLREWMAGKGEGSKVKVSFAGKAKTVAQMFSLGFLIYEYDLMGVPIYTIGLVLLVFAAVLTLYSLLIYLRSAWSTIKASSS